MNSFFAEGDILTFNKKSQAYFVLIKKINDRRLEYGNEDWLYITNIGPRRVEHGTFRRDDNMIFHVRLVDEQCI